MPPKDRDIAMIFQNYALYPHMTAARNMGFALRMRKVPSGQIRERVTDAAGVLGLMQALDKRPRTLSGGQRQRVAMGRAIVREPQAFLMDEPLSNLDAKLRVEMRAEIARLQRDLGVTTIYVTHDQTEAMTLGDRVAVMRDGVLQQLAPPQELYREPRNLFVAEFIGSPAMNLVGVDLERSNGSLVAAFGDSRLTLDDSAALTPFVGKRMILGVRPEHIEDAAIASDAPEGRRLAAVVDIREDLGSDVYVHFAVGGPPRPRGRRQGCCRRRRGRDVRSADEAQGQSLGRARRPHEPSQRGRPDRARRRHIPASLLRPKNGDGIYADPDYRTDSTEGV
jgi:multiple sugar transport system ATP-binding protein